MTDPLTYLDEVDVRQADAVKFDGQIPISMAIGVKFDLPALSKALREVLAQADALDAMADEPIGIGEVGSALRLAARGIRNAIQAALAVNDEGGTT